MDRLRLSRRQMTGAALAAALVRPLVSRADPATGTRIPSSEDVYEPPTNLGMVADLYRRMSAPLFIDGHGPFPFIVDTGANQSVISAELAARLSLPLGPEVPVNGVAGVQMAPTARATISIGPRRRRPVNLLVLPALAIGGAGLLGLDGLDGQSLALDFKRGVLRIERSQRGLADGREVTLKARRRDGQLTLVDAHIAGIPITAFVDSGAQSTIGNRALQQLASRRQAGVWSTADIVSVTGQTIASDLADLPSLRFGGMSLPHWRVAFADLHTFQLWNLTERPAILVGIDVLSRFETVTLDFARDEVRFRLPDSRLVREVHA